MKKQNIYFLVIVLLVSLVIFQKCDNDRRVNKVTAKVQQSELKITEANQRIKELQGQKNFLITRVDSLEKVKQKVITKYETKIKLVETFSFAELSEDITFKLTSVCGAENKPKQVINKQDSFVLFDKENLMCVVREFEKSAACQELLIIEQCVTGELKEVVQVQEKVIDLKDIVITQKDTQIETINKAWEKELSRNNRVKNVNRWLFTGVAVSVAANVLLLMQH